MRFTVLFVVLICYGYSKEAWARTVDNFEVYHSISSHDAAKSKELPSIDEFLDNMSDKYSTIDKEILELRQHYELSNEQSIDCHSSRTSELMSIKKNYDSCNKMTNELKKLKNATLYSLEIISEIGYESSEIIASGIQCASYESSSMQLNCVIELVLHSRVFIHEITPKFYKLAGSLQVFAQLINVETFYCLLHYHIDSNTAKEIAQTWIKCQI